MTVLTITSSKGGCGKTMIGTALLASMAAEGIDAALLDADPNASAYRWATATYDGQVSLVAYAEAGAERLADLLPDLANKHALLICDTAGFGNQAATVCIAGADAVLVPVSPGEGDVIEGQRTVAYVEGLGRSTRRSIPARIVLNRVRKGTTLSRHVLSQVESMGLARLVTVMSEAVGYGEMGFSGSLPRDGAAFEEIANLVTELRSLGWLPKVEKPTIRKDVKA
jgi:chromosome partitioning protein